MPHGVASDKVSQDGETLTMDFIYNHYVSDTTRTVRNKDGWADEKKREICPA